MKKLLLGMIITAALFMAACSSMGQQKAGSSREGPVISPSPSGTPSETIPYQ